MRRVAAVCGLPDIWPNLPDFDIKKVNYWQNKMTGREIALVSNILAPYIEMMEYSV
jgi:hypothetical protein